MFFQDYFPCLQTPLVFWTPHLFLSASFLNTYFPQNTIYLSYFVSLFSHILSLYKPFYATHIIPFFFVIILFVLNSHFSSSLGKICVAFYISFYYRRHYNPPFSVDHLLPLLLNLSYFRSSLFLPLPD